MELPGSDYFFTLSILAITFATVSALVTIVRQIKGGPLSEADVHLVTTFISAGFAQCIAAILPPLVHLLGINGRGLWAIASGIAALLFAVLVIRIQRERVTLAMARLRSFAIVVFVGLWLSVLILAVNAVVPAVQGAGLHAAAVTLALGTVMWSFVRRIASLSGDGASADWDLRKG